MNDPHIEALIYRVEHGPTVDYDKAEPLEYASSIFNVRIENGQARFELKEHFATEEAARDAVEPFIRAWEVVAGLDQGPNRFALVFDTSEVIDRDPPPGVNIYATVGRMTFTALPVTVHLGYGHYPEPAPHLTVSSDVEKMYSRYTLYRQGSDRLGTVAAFCLGVLEESIGTTHKRRQKAADKYCISPRVLNKLGSLTATKGGTEARKAAAAHEEFTAHEKAWLEATIKAIIRRAAVVACNSSQELPQITLADLPPLSPPS